MLNKTHLSIIMYHKLYFIAYLKLLGKKIRFIDVQNYANNETGNNTANGMDGNNNNGWIILHGIYLYLHLLV